MPVGPVVTESAKWGKNPPVLAAFKHKTARDLACVQSGKENRGLGLHRRCILCPLLVGGRGLYMVGKCQP